MNLQIGMTLHGFCGGAFGRDSYATKRIEALGPDWIIARDNEGNVHIAIFDNQAHMESFVRDWDEQGRISTD